MAAILKTNCKRILVLLLLGLLVGVGHATSGETVTDSEIGNAVDKRLIDDPAVPADNLEVASTRGIVTLSGTVDNILARDRAKSLAETVKGVKAVVNRIEIAPSLRSDKMIKEDVEQALHTDPATEQWEIDVLVDDGVVTLSGAVDSMMEKELSGRIAKGVAGVKKLNNNLTIAYITDRPDREIKAEIKKALRWDTLVDDALIQVTVKDGQVKLKGTVGSAAEKERAWRKAWVAGVGSVDYRGLEVKYWARDEMLRKDKYVSKPEAETEDAVLDALRYDPRVNISNVLVDVEGGIATLRGSVSDLKQKRAASIDARNVLGVWAVKNRLKIQPASLPGDSLIEANLKSALIRDPVTDQYEIEVVANNGEVYLYGNVDSSYEKARADDVAARQAGVIRVHNFLTVHDRSGAAYEPYADDWAIYNYDWYTARGNLTPKTDWEISRDIEDELFWSPFVDSDQVKVDVEDGSAELTGTVDTWREREAAEENARQGGAIHVDNDLTVAYGPEYYRR
jgi:osmotically-inducible protein OsmY